MLEIVFELSRETIIELGEILVEDISFIENMNSRVKIVNEAMRAKLYAKENNAAIAQIFIADKSLSSRNEGDMNHGARVKLKDSDTFRIKGDGIEFILPKGTTFEKNLF